MSVVAKIEGYEKTLAATLPAVVAAVVTLLSDAADILPAGAANYVLLALSFLTVVSVWLTKNAEPIAAEADRVINDVANSVAPVVAQVAPQYVDSFKAKLDAAEHVVGEAKQVALDTAKAVTDEAETVQ